MYNFRMLNRRPLVLPALDTLVPMVGITFRPYTNKQARDHLREIPNLLYNPHSGWYFALSNKGIEKMPVEQYDDNENITLIHLSAVANLDILISHAVLGYSKLEAPTRINSNGKPVTANIDIKAVHRFYTGAWINDKPYSVRLLIQEFHDGRVELGEEANAYALNIKEMRGIVSGTSVPPASLGLTTAPTYDPLIKDDISGISAPSSRCKPAPPTSIPLTSAKIVQGERKCKLVCDLPSRSLSSERQFRKIRILIESNLKEGEETLYRQREAFDYSKTGTDRVETIFDRLRLTDEERQQLYDGHEITVHNIKIRSNKIDATLSFRNGELKLMPTD